MKDHDLEQPDNGPLTAEPAGMDDSGADEIADLIRKVKTGQPVKISTDMPVKVTSDEPIKGSTTDKLNARSDDKPEDENYDNSPDPKTRDYNPNDFAQVVNKVRDFDYTPPGSGSNPMPDPNEKKEESISPVAAFEAKLMADYKKFMAEGPDMDKVPAFIRKQKEKSQKTADAATEKRNQSSGAKVWSHKR
jgi:hypothetical protein